jgi:hypothetical protein
LAGRTRIVCRALGLRRIGNTKSLVTSMARLTGLLVGTTNLAFPIHADFAGTTFVTVVAADNTEVGDTHHVLETIRSGSTAARGHVGVAWCIPTRSAHSGNSTGSACFTCSTGPASAA